MMRKYICCFVFLCRVLSGVSAQDLPDENEGKEIPNTVGAVKAANPGDYILLPSGKKYTLTGEEIEIVNDRFDYNDLSGVKTEVREDGTEIKTISEAHTAYIYPDGQSDHIIKTSGSFTKFMQQHIERNFFLAHYVDASGNYHDAAPNGSPRFYVFRASVQFQTISDGVNEVEGVIITAFNYKGENFIMRYISTDEDWTWGHVRGTYGPTGETRQIEFDIE